MSTTRKARLSTLERATGALRRGGVLTLREGESPEAALARAAAAGRLGPYLLMPPPLGESEWEAQTVRHQQDLAEQAKAHMAMLAERHKPDPNLESLR